MIAGAKELRSAWTSLNIVEKHGGKCDAIVRLFLMSRANWYFVHGCYEIQMLSDAAKDDLPFDFSKAKNRNGNFLL